MFSRLKLSNFVGRDIIITLPKALKDLRQPQRRMEHLEKKIFKGDLSIFSMEKFACSRLAILLIQLRVPGPSGTYCIYDPSPNLCGATTTIDHDCITNVDRGTQRLNFE